MLDTVSHLLYQLRIFLEVISPYVLSFFSALIQALLVQHIQTCIQIWRDGGSQSGNHNQVGGDGPQSAPISLKNAITLCHSPARATSNSVPRAS